jgi:hypothetical protein
MSRTRGHGLSAERQFFRRIFRLLSRIGPVQPYDLMSAKPTTDWNEDLNQIVTGRFPEGLVRMLERRYPGASSGDYPPCGTCCIGSR